MKLIIRDIVKYRGNEALLDGAGFTFSQGRAYGITGNKKERKALLDCIAFESEYEDGTMELDCGGVNCLFPEMVGQFTEEPAFPEFLTVKEFLKYYIDINRKEIDELKDMDDYLAMAGLDHVKNDRIIRDFTYEETLRLQFLCFMIVTPPILIVRIAKAINNVDLLKDIKRYVDIIKQNGIVLVDCTSLAIDEYLCDERVTIEQGCIRGGV